MATFMSQKSTRPFLFFYLLSIASILFFSGSPSDSKAYGKTHKKAYPLLVPPPPAYMPSILPELKVAQKTLVHKPVNPVKKYIYTRDGYEDPTPVKTNEHVTYWNSSEVKSN